MKIIRINKNGSMNELDLKIPKNCLNVLKKNSISCGNGNIKELYFWKYDGKNIKCYGWYDGESGFENKHELAPNGTSTFLEEDSSSKLLFGDLFILCLDAEKKYNDFGVDDYSMFYEIINEGFDNCSDTEDSDGYSDEDSIDIDIDYNPNNDNSDSDDNEIDSEEFNENELLDTDNNIY
jgi:hypothetical protein